MRTIENIPEEDILNLKADLKDRQFFLRRKINFALASSENSPLNIFQIRYFKFMYDYSMRKAKEKYGNKFFELEENYKGISKKYEKVMKRFSKEKKGLLVRSQ